jgi:hypothetical protein
MAVFGRRHMPSLGGAEWLNSEPLGPAELRGHVVLVILLDDETSVEPQVEAACQRDRRVTPRRVDEGAVVRATHDHILVLTGG